MPDPAVADIYAFTDEKGMVHVTNVPQDRRYRLILRVPEAAAERRAGRRAREPVRRFQQQVAQAGQASRVAPVSRRCWSSVCSSATICVCVTFVPDLPT
ncbi:lytic murein transglycosylase [Thauera aromatica K172]|uniref:Lytic murein transglycosylase n=1 Tax=Thauera aromatica K172 TaxID=44139 RepID=A0A2R4BM46_THAAR|nr:lytic murein transglycosylase [Thauera aromatica K172]